MLAPADYNRPLAKNSNHMAGMPVGLTRVGDPGQDPSGVLGEAGDGVPVAKNGAYVRRRAVEADFHMSLATATRVLICSTALIHKGAAR